MNLTVFFAVTSRAIPGLVIMRTFARSRTAPATRGWSGSQGFHGALPRWAGLALVLAILLETSAGPAWAGPAEGEETAPAMPPGGISESALDLETVRAKRKEIEANQGLEAGLKEKLLRLFHRSEGRLETASAYEQTAAGYQQAISTAPQEIAAARKSLENPPLLPTTLADLKLSKLSQSSLQDIAQRLLLKQVDLTKWKSEIDALDKRLGEQQERPALIRVQLAQAAQKLEAAERDLRETPEPDTPPLLIEARKRSRQSRQRERIKEIAMLEQELLSHDLRLELLTAQRDLKAMALAAAEARVQVLEEALNRLRQLEAERAQAAAAKVQQEVAKKHPLVKQTAEKNALLSQELSKLIAATHRAEEQRARLEGEAKRIKEDYRGARQKLEVAGLSTALGQVLREQRRRLERLSRYRKDSERRQVEISEAGLHQYRIDEQRRLLADLDKAVANLMQNAVQHGQAIAGHKDLRQDLRALIKDQQVVLKKLAAANSDYLRVLGDLDFIQQQLVDVAGQYATFLDERLLWIPSASTATLLSWPDLAAAVGWILVPKHWREVGQSLLAELRRSPATTIGMVVVLASLFRLRRRLKQDLLTLNEKVAKPYSDRFGLTVRAILITLLLEMPWSLLVAFPGWRLLAHAEGSEFSRALGTALVAVALPVFLFRSFSRLCRPRGLVEVHLRWNTKAVEVLQRNLRWLMVFVLSAVLITSLLGAQSQYIYQETLGCIAFIVSMTALAVFVYRVLHTERGALATYLQRYPRGWTARLRYVWFPAAIGLPLALAGLAVLGYYATASELAAQLVATVWLVAGAVIGHDLVIRWMLLENRKLTLQMVRDKRFTARLTEAGKDASGELPPTPAEDVELDISRINVQTRQVLRTLIGLSLLVGLWFIWSPVLPALAILDQVAVWETTEVVDGQDLRHPVTLANLALALAILIVAYVATRNLAGVLEITLFRHLLITPGGRYAVTHVARYVLVSVAAIGVFNTLGGRWSQVQWLVAALSVGLGFGLQEIFANFVSGLILLMERPMRVGDTVTVGDVTGQVTRIRIRATTILDGDRRELVVPNKTFITDRLINWTLSDPITRVGARIGIAHGSDIQLAHRVILAAVQSVPLVLKDPAPALFFVGSADSSLEFQLSVFVKDLNERMPVTHALHEAIEQALREHNLQVPGPQRDLHVWLKDPSGGMQAMTAALRSA
ncbi:MAG: mechanosensitive ion channel domain-containing protein [Gammaproteobacteria bacterium]